MYTYFYVYRLAQNEIYKYVLGIRVGWTPKCKLTQ